MIWRCIRSILFLFDAESIHNFSSFFLKVHSRFIPKEKLLAHKKTKFSLAGFSLDSPLGLAAGFDKNATMIPALRSRGFGFVEIGSVTPRAQAGNPLPRLFRLPHSQALINRMGFNSIGAALVAARLTQLRAGGNLGFPVGVNLGKNRDTPLERAGEDYIVALEKLYAVSDYLVVNLSSPNTPSLTDLQEASFLQPLLSSVCEARDRMARSFGGEARPLFLKISPDLTPEAQIQALGIAMNAGFAGIIASNTSRRRDLPGIDRLDAAVLSQEGGLSGKPLLKETLGNIPRLRTALGPKPCLIAVGGIFSRQDGEALLDSGASLLQAYTGFIYGGPRFPSQFLGLALEKGE